MIKVSVLYANRNGAKFDMDYYCNRHIVLVRQLLGDAVKGLEVDQGVASSQDPVPFLAIGHLWFDSVEDFQAGLAAHGPAIMADISNYTNVEPVIQVSEIKVSNGLAAYQTGR